MLKLYFRCLMIHSRQGSPNSFVGDTILFCKWAKTLCATLFVKIQPKGIRQLVVCLGRRRNKYGIETILRVMKWRPRGGMEPDVRLFDESYPVEAPPHLTIPSRPSRRLSPYLWGESKVRHKTQSIRQVAGEYGVSHETIRRTLSAMDHQTPKVEL